MRSAAEPGGENSMLSTTSGQLQTRNDSEIHLCARSDCIFIVGCLSIDHHRRVEPGVDQIEHDASVEVRLPFETKRPCMGAIRGRGDVRKIPAGSECAGVQRIAAVEVAAVEPAV